MSQNIADESQTTTDQPTSADFLGKMSEAIETLLAAQEKLVQAAADVAKHTTDPNAHGAATLANIAKAMPKPVLEDGMFTFKDAAGKPLMEPVNIKGDTGEKGEKGEDGDKGDMPDHRWNGTALQIQNPDGSWGEEQDLQGPKGLDGADGAPGLAPAHEWDGTLLKFKNPDGTWGEEQNLQGPKGEDGADGADGAPGSMPDHQWDGTSLQIQKPDGTWGEPQDLKGEKGDPGDAAIATAEQPGAVQPDGVTTTVDEAGLLSALGGNLLLNSEQWITESGEWEAPVRGWYKLLLFSGGESGRASTSWGAVVGGGSGGIKIALVYLGEGQQVPVVIGAGGPAPAAADGTYNDGGLTTFGEVSTGETQPESWQRAFRGGHSPAGMATGVSTHYGEGGGIGGGYPSLPETYPTQAERNAKCNAKGHYGGGGGACLTSAGLWGAGAGAPGSVLVRWHDPAKAAGPLPEPALLSARRLAPLAAAAPATVNLYDPETGQGSVWREEDAEAKLAEGKITEEAWLEICAQKAAEEYAAWLADPETEAERFEMLRAARDAKLAATDYLVAPDYPLTDEQRAAVTAYRQALRDLPAQEGAPWDGGGELTPWPEMPAVSNAQVEPDEPEQTEEPEV